MEERLLALLYKTTGRKPRYGETIWQSLHRYCWPYNTRSISYPKTDALWDALRDAKKSKITRDGYLAKYYVLYDQCWPALIEDVAEYGIVLTILSYFVRLEYKHLPEIFVDASDCWTGREVDMFPKFPFTELQKKLIFQYGTPYQEEVIQLRLVARLPQPIAEAISDCIMAVIERRYLSKSAPILSYLGKNASMQEIRYTAHEFGMDYKEVDITGDIRDWESYIVPRCESSSDDDGWNPC